MPTVTLDGSYAMALLDVPAPDWKIVRVPTARRLAREGLIAPQQYTPPPGEVVIEWEVTAAGRDILRGVDEAGELAR